MAVMVQTTNPANLLASIKRAIDQGHIQTWSYDADGDFTHTPDQWRNQAWLRPNVVLGALKFGMLNNRNVKTTKALYGIYHGRFIEALLAHFDTNMSSIGATPMPVPGLDILPA